MGEVYEATLVREQERLAREEAAREAEIAEIKREVKQQRMRWDTANSDDEGGGAESEAVAQDQARRNDVLSAVLAEVQKVNDTSYRPQLITRLGEHQSERG